MLRAYWTQEMDDELKILLKREEQFPYAQIAIKISERFNRHVTRYSCIGRAFRLGLPIRTPRKSKPYARKPSANSVMAKAKVTRRMPVDAPILPVEAALPIELPETPDGIHHSRDLTILQLRYGLCKWPDGEHAPYRYCGHRTEKGASFCPYHYDKAYKPGKEYAP